MAFTAWIMVWYKVSGIQKQSTREVSNSAYWGQTMAGVFLEPDSGIRIAEMRFS
jgi:hypothetical protein